MSTGEEKKYKRVSAEIFTSAHAFIQRDVGRGDGFTNIGKPISGLFEKLNPITVGIAKDVVWNRLTPAVCKKLNGINISNGEELRVMYAEDEEKVLGSVGANQTQVIKRALGIVL